MQLECTGKQVKQYMLNNVNSTTNKKALFHIVNFRFWKMLRNWFTATVDIIVIVWVYLFSS